MSRTASTKKVMVSMELTLPVECSVPERWTLDQRYSGAVIAVFRGQHADQLVKEACNLLYVPAPLESIQSEDLQDPRGSVNLES